MTPSSTRTPCSAADAPSPSSLDFSPRRGLVFRFPSSPESAPYKPEAGLAPALERLDTIYRGLCGLMYNFVPLSGHPGGSISSGRIVNTLLYHAMDYDLGDPDRKDADHLCYAAGHKALGLYAAWALRNECARIARPGLLPTDHRRQLRLEDLLGFRRNPITRTPLFRQFQSKALDGHPTPGTPFVRLATGASGVGVAAAIGLAFGALDTYGDDAPRIHILEGEGGLTPGRVQEALAAAGTAQIRNIVLHVDWNQASIDSNRVCRDGGSPGDYVQWNPAELAWMHDWNVLFVEDGFDFNQILAAQHLATKGVGNSQPTAIIYRTVKGWKYGIEGRASHGAGHAFCSPEFYASLAECEGECCMEFPRFTGPQTPEAIEANFWECLEMLRAILECDDATPALAGRLQAARDRLQERSRSPRADAPALASLYDDPELDVAQPPAGTSPKPGETATHRGVLGDVLGCLNRRTGGAFIGSSADLLGSTSITNLAKGLSEGLYTFEGNPSARLIALGGICEDAMGGFMAGLSAFGNHVGVGTSYAAFIAALQHVPARLHSIGQEARLHAFGDPRKPFVVVCGHAGPKTGEDGPTHADPQALQLLQGNFPHGSLITLTPWDTQEIWPLMLTALRARPAVIAPFVTRPSETVVDREAAGLPPAWRAAQGVYALRRTAHGSRRHGTLVLQGNGVAAEFVTRVLPQLDRRGLHFNIYYVASAELFDLLPPAEQEALFPEEFAREAMGITEFTLPTMYRWVTSFEGRRRTLHPLPGRTIPGQRPGGQSVRRRRSARRSPVGSRTRLRRERPIAMRGELNTQARQAEKQRNAMRMPGAEKAYKRLISTVCPSSDPLFFESRA